MTDLTLDDIMSEKMITVKESLKIKNVTSLLLRYQINGVLVTRDDDEKDVVGILTTTDLLNLVSKAVSRKKDLLDMFDDISELRVGEIASKDVVSLQRDTAVIKAVEIMDAKKVHTLPVYDQERLVGVVGKHDLLDVTLGRRRKFFLRENKFEEKKTILTIEDNAVDQRFIQKVFKKQGYRVLLARTGKEGLEIALNEKVDLIILDLILPDIKGNVVFESLKKNKQTEKIPVLILTVVNTPFDIIENFTLGAMNYLVKPISAKQLLTQAEYVWDYKE